jgi:hypothetical protein
MLEDLAVCDPGRIARRRQGARQPGTHASLIAMLPLFDFRHKQAGALRGIGPSCAPQHRPRRRPVARVDGRPGHGQRAFRVIGAKFREPADAVQPIAR